MLHTQQRPYSMGPSWEPQDQVTQKFQHYDKNKDGLLEKGEFRSLLKDIFSSQTSQFLDDAIEETVWRVESVNLPAVKQAIISISDTLQLDTKSILSTPLPTASLSKPYNAQGQQLPQQSSVSQSFNPFLSSSVPPPKPISEWPDLPPPILDPRTLPPPPILAPPSTIEAVKLPPPPQPQGVGSLKRPLPPRVGEAAPKPMGVPMKKQPVMMKLPAKFPGKVGAKVPAKPAAPLSSSQELQGNKRTSVRSFPQGEVLAHPGLQSTVNIPAEESRAFVEYINTNAALQQDNDVKGILPISSTSAQIYNIVSDGWLFCKLLNGIQPGIIPVSQIKLRPKNAFEKIENHTLAIQAAKKLGCFVVNIGPEDLLQGKPRLVLGLLWQIIKRDVLSKVSLAQHPEIYKLAKSTNNLKEISDSSPEEVLLKWANHHLKKANGGAEIANFSNDVKDGTTYTLLMNQIAPDVCNTAALQERDINRRAQMVVDNAKKLKCDRFVTASDIVNGNANLNLAFVADLFNKHSGLELPTLEEMEKLKKQNASLTSVLDEAEAKLRQILADGQLAHELQQQEILMYRQRKLKEQEELAEQEAMLRAQVQREEMLMLQQQKMKEMSLKEQEQFAREEQRKEEMKAGKRLSTSGSYSKSSFSSSNSNNKSSLSSSGSYAKSSFASSSSANNNISQATADFIAAALPQPSSNYSSYSSTSYQTPSASTYSTTAPPASHYATSTTTQPPRNVYSDSSPNTYNSVFSDTSSLSGYSSGYSTAKATEGSYSAAYAPQPPGPSSLYGSGGYSQPSNYSQPSYSQPPYSQPSSYSQPPYPQSSYAPPPPPPQYSSNPYNHPAPTSDYPSSSSSTYSSTQTTYTEPPLVSSFPETEMSPVSRRRGVFERFGKKIDKAFH